MKTVILYGDQKNLGLFQQELEEYSTLYLSDQDELIHTLMKKCPAAVLVIMEKAAGMEGVIAIRKIYPDIPVVWFSNDEGFAAQAFRLNVDYFALMPVSKEKINTALKKCRFTV